MKQWIGKWLIGVSVLHTAVAGVFFGKTYLAMVSGGLWGARLRSAVESAAAWFLLFGVLTFIAGQAVSVAERSGQPLPKTLGIALLFLAVLGIILMPASGFWLVLPPALALLWPVRRSRAVGAAA